MFKKLEICMMILIIGSLLALNYNAISTGSPNEPFEIVASDDSSAVRATIWNSVIVLDSNVLVPKGEELRIESGAKIFVEDNVGIFIEGTLIITGTKEGPVIFSGAGSSLKWSGIQFNISANTIKSSIKHCIIQDAKTGCAYNSGHVSISDTDFKNNDVGVFSYLASGFIQNTSFESNGRAVAADSSDITITNCNISSSISFDISVQNDAHLKLINVLYDENKIEIDDIFSDLEIRWYLKISIIDAKYPENFGSKIKINDFYGDEIYAQVLESTLSTPYLEFTAKILSADAAFPGKILKKYFTSHLITVERFGAKKTQIVYLDSNKHLIFNWNFNSGIGKSADGVLVECQEAFLHDFVNLGWKHTTRQEKVNASNYLASRMRQLGNFQVEFDNHTHLNYPIDDGRNVTLQLVNVVCTLPGTNGNQDSYVTLTAHYDTDHHKDVVGADDDGSGVTGLLEIARIIGRMKFNYTIKIIFFDGEEEDYIGSYDYVKAASDNGHNIIADINLDMIGHNRNLSFPCIIRTNPNSLGIAQTVGTLNSAYGFGLDTTIINDASYRRSDYFRFWDFGYPAIDFVEAETVETWNVYYHTAQDSYDKINFTYLKKMTQLATAGLLTLAGPANSAPTSPGIVMPESSHQQRPTLSWTPSVDIDGDSINYNLVVNDGTRVIANKTILENSYSFDTNLSYGKTYSITLTAIDTKGVSSEPVNSELVIYNTPPVLISIPGQNLTQDQVWELQVTANDQDLPADVLTYSVSPELFKIAKETGYVNWTPSKFDVGEYQVNFSVSDGKGGIDFQHVKIHIENVNDPPEVNFSQGVLYFNEDTILENAFNLNELFFDIDHDILTYTFLNNDKIEINALENGSVNLGAAENWFGSESIEIIAADASGLNISQTIEVIVNPVNDAPELAFIADVILNETELLEVIPYALDIENDELSYSFTGIGENGIWQTDYFSAGTYWMNITVTDGELFDWQLMKIYVNNKNRVPELKEAPPETLNLKVNEEFSISARFFDPDDDLNSNGIIDGQEFDNLTYSWNLDDGTVKSGSSISHSYSKSGKYLVVLSVNDTNNGSFNVMINIKVEEINDLSFGEMALYVIIIIIIVLVLFIIIMFFLRKRYLKRTREKKDIREKKEDMIRDNQKAGEEE